MEFNAYQASKVMYYALDAAYDEINNEALLQFISEANPFIWKDEGSADPAVYIEFKEAFDKEFGATADEQKSLEFVRKYLENEGPPSLIEAFDSIVTPENWIDGLKA